MPLSAVAYTCLHMWILLQRRRGVRSVDEREVGRQAVLGLHLGYALGHGLHMAGPINALKNVNKILPIVAIIATVIKIIFFII